MRPHKCNCNKDPKKKVQKLIKKIETMLMFGILTESSVLPVSVLLIGDPSKLISSLFT